ncbi:hypothetical protein HMPREF1985_01219 [Mitsuokella sp. oral taxon 131 str. W9106]|nr:hypothetical protein HMPREF1985_01219 [Mitsuokella sp. oral taxon 131 str. W9106]
MSESHFLSCPQETMKSPFSFHLLCYNRNIKLMEDEEEVLKK